MPFIQIPATNVMISRLHIEEIEEKIELQVSQCRQKATEAHERYVAAIGNREEADENLRCAKACNLSFRLDPVLSLFERAK